MSLVVNLLGRGRDGDLNRGLTAGATGSLALRVGLTGLSVVISIMLARFLGAGQYGYYTYALAWINLIAVPTGLGLDRLLVREVAVYQAQSKWRLLRGLLRRSNQAVLCTSLLVALAGGVTGALIFKGVMQSTFCFAILLLPVFGLTRLRQGAMRGLGRVVLGQTPEMLVQPLFFAVLIGVGYLLLRGNLTASGAVALHVASATIAFLVGYVLLCRHIPEPARAAQPEYETRVWASSVLPLLVISSMNIMNARVDAIMLGALRSPEVVGIYRVATRGANLITLVLFAVNAALAPMVARLYLANEKERLQRLVTRSARAITLFSLPVALGMILFGRWFLMLFGQEFADAGAALAILSLGRLINATMGPVSLLLVMTNHERYASIGIGFSVVLNVLLNWFLVPRYGVEGAAIATAASGALRNILLAILVVKCTGIHSTALGKICLKSKTRLEDN